MNKKILIALGILVISMGIFFAIFFINDKNNNQNENDNGSNPEQNENIDKENPNNNEVVESNGFDTAPKFETDENESFKFENLSSDAYGYIRISRDNSEEIVELRKNSPSKVIASCIGDCGLFGLNIRNGEFYFYVHHYLNRDETNAATKGVEKIISINLESLKPKLIMATDKYSVNHYYDFAGDYVFTLPYGIEKGIEKYNVKTGELKKIANEISGYDMFVAKDKIYVIDSSVDGTSYAVVDFDGNVLEKITEQQYYDAARSINRGMSPDYNSSIYMYHNGQKISVSSDGNKLMLGDEIIYTTKEGQQIELYYSENYNEIAFGEYKMGEQALVDEKYHIYNIENKSLKEVDILDLTDFYDYVFFK